MKLESTRKIAVMGCVNGEVYGKPWIWIPRVIIEWVNSSNSLFGTYCVNKMNLIVFIFYLVLFNGGNKGLEPQFCACSLTPVSLC
jgi:hypothetical protein